MNYLDRSGCTTLLTFELGELDHERAVAMGANGLLRLRSKLRPSRFIALRSFQVDKFHGSDFLSGAHLGRRHHYLRTPH